MTTRQLFPNLTHLSPEAYSEPFWLAAKEHRFVCQRCADCNTFCMPPAPYCAGCQSANREWVDIPGTGSVYSYSVVNYTLTKDITQEDLPYVVVVVKLDGCDEQKFIGVLVGDGAVGVQVDDRVETLWQDYPETEMSAPRFVLTGGRA